MRQASTRVRRERVRLQPEPEDWLADEPTLEPAPAVRPQGARAAGRRRAGLPRHRRRPTTHQPAPLVALVANDDDDEPPEEDTQTSLFDTGDASDKPDYKLPDRSLLKKSKPGEGPNAEQIKRTAEVLVQCLANFGVEATVDRPDLRPARHALRAAARARDEGRRRSRS